MTLPRLLFLFTALIVFSLGAGSAIGAFGDTHSIFCLGFAAPAGSGGCHPVLIRLGDSGIASIRVVRGFRAVTVLRGRRSIPILLGGCDGTSIRVVGGFLAVAGLRGCHSTLILLRGSHRARIRVDGNGTLTVGTNGLAAQVGDAICPPYIGSNNIHININETFIRISYIWPGPPKSLCGPIQSNHRRTGPCRKHRHTSGETR